MNEKFEPIKFDSWQELAKYVIDGGECFVLFNGEYKIVKFDGMQFNWNLLINKFYIKKQPTLEELIAIKPRLCWVWDKVESNKSIKVVYDYNKGSYCPYLLFNNVGFVNAQMLTDDEIKQFLNGE